MALSRPDDIVHITQKLSGCPVLLGTITATTSAKNNHDTAVPFNDTAGNASLQCRFLLVQPDVACRIKVGNDNAVAALASVSVYLDANEKFYILMADGYAWLSCRSESGTCNLRVFELI